MRKILTAVTSAALALSMVAQATPALAVSGYDSLYQGESDFVALTPGQSNDFQVFFSNTGTTTWTRGTSTQVDLAACMEDKNTCNAQDASEAAWNPGTWLSSVRYATTQQTSVGPGGVATFKYTVTAPIGATAGLYRFNGDLVLASTGERIHPEGYYQDATIGGTGGAAVLTSLAPDNGTTAGGNSVTINGSGFVCTPAFPIVKFGTNTAAVTSCGASTLTATAPAGAAGGVTVTATNTGAGASNGLTYTYKDTTKPSFASVSVAGNVYTVTFTEKVCRATGTALDAGEWAITVNGGAATNPTGDLAPTCDSNTAATNGVTSFQLIGPATIVGDFITVTLNTGAADADTFDPDYIDSAGNTANAPQTQQATAIAPETVKPTIISMAAAAGTNQLVVTYSEPVYCPDAREGGELSAASTGNPTLTNTADNCAATSGLATNKVTYTMSGPFVGGASYAVTTTFTAGELQDVVGNDITNTTFTFTAGASDFTPPTITDTRLTANVGTTDWVEATDAFSMTFSEAMETTTAGDTITIQDADGTLVTVTCGVDVSCTWNASATTVTVAITGVLAPTTAGTIANIQIPATVVSLSGFADAAVPGNTPNLPGSADRVIDYE